MAREKKRFSFSSLSESTWAAAFRGYYYSPVTARIKAADRRPGPKTMQRYNFLSVYQRKFWNLSKQKLSNP